MPWRKILENVLNFGSKNLNEPCRLRSHSKGRIFHMVKNLTRHFVHTEPFNLFALFTQNQRTRLNFICLLTMVLLSVHGHSAILAHPKWRFPTTSLPYKNLDGDDVHTTQIKGLTIPTKNLISILFIALIFNRSKTLSVPV